MSAENRFPIQQRKYLKNGAGNRGLGTAQTAKFQILFLGMSNQNLSQQQTCTDKINDKV